MAKNECLNCPNRHLGCHDECDTYKKFDAERKLINKNRYIENYKKR